MATPIVSDAERYCCANCFSDYAICGYIRDQGEIGECTFCASTNISIIKIPSVVHFIDEGIARKYEDVADTVPIGIGRAGYWNRLLNVAGALAEENAINVDIEPNDELVEIIGHASKYSSAHLRQKFPYEDRAAGPPHVSTWERFSEYVKHTSRFTAFHKYTDHIRLKSCGSVAASEPKSDEHKRNAFWWDFDRFVGEYEREIPNGTTIYRARPWDEGRAFEPSDLSSPPLKDTRDCRMSPRGISYFYGGFDQKTCIAEVQPYLDKIVAVQEFITSLDIHVLDLTNIPESRSIFDAGYSLELNEYFVPFLWEFAKDISRPVSPDEKSIEYLPTQAFCEFLQIREFGKLVQGVRYWSAMRSGGDCVVLFKGPDILGDSGLLRPNGNPKYTTIEKIDFCQSPFRETPNLDI